MRKYLYLFLGIMACTAQAQQVDSTNAKTIHKMEVIIDSLRQTIRYLDNELQQVKQNMVSGKTDVDELLSLLNGEDVESGSEDQRSRRKQVDALLRAITQRPGRLRLNGSATTILQGGSFQGAEHSTGVGSFDIFAHTTFGPQTLFFIDLEAIGGNGPDEFFPTLAGLNGDAGSTQDTDGVDRLTVLEAWLEFSLFDQALSVTAGKIDLTNYFDNNASANDETMQFISGGFVNSAALAVVPNSPGIRFGSTLLNRFHFHLGLVSADNSGSDLFKDIFKIGSLGVTLLPGSDFESNLLVYAYQHPLADNAAGWGLSFDKATYGNLNVFARYGENSKKVTDWFGIKSAWSAGARLIKELAGHTTVFGAAYGENNTGLKPLKTEKLFEFYARRQLNQWVHISPHLQMVWNALGADSNFAIFGARTHFNF